MALRLLQRLLKGLHLSRYRKKVKRMTQQEIYQLAISVGFPTSDARVAAAIAMAESSGDPRALNPRGCDISYGLWQINMVEGRKGCASLGAKRRAAWGLSSNDQLYDPRVNARAAYSLYRARGGRFTDWTTYTHGTYRQFLSASPATPKTTQGQGAAGQKAPAPGSDGGSGTGFEEAPPPPGGEGGIATSTVLIAIAVAVAALALMR